MDFLKTEFKRFFSVTKWVLSLYFKTFPVYTTIYVVCRILVSFSNLFNAYVIALVTDEAIKLIGTGQISSSIYKILALFLGTAFFFTLVDIVNS
jgi:hypothetical protein